MKTVSGFVSGLLLAGAVAGCGAAPADPTKGARVVNVVASVNMWGDVARQIGGRHASVTSIIASPSDDPHLYSSSPRDAARLARANLVVLNGLGYDDWAHKLLDASSSSKRYELTIADALKPTGSNPHLWYDAPRLPDAARAIADALAAQDPRDKAYFNANASRFVASLTPLLDTIATIENRHPGAPVAYTERVPQYLLDAAGLKIETPRGYAQAVEDGSKPNPVSKRDIDALLYNAQAVTPATKRLRALATSSHVPVVPVTETLPPGLAFQRWQTDQARALLGALGGAA